MLENGAKFDPIFIIEKKFLHREKLNCFKIKNLYCQGKQLKNCTEQVDPDFQNDDTQC